MAIREKGRAGADKERSKGRASPARPPGPRTAGPNKAPEGAPAAPVPQDRSRSATGRTHEFASLRLWEETVDDLRRIAARDGVTIAELIERSVAAYERHRLERANERGARRPGETDDDFIRRVLIAAGEQG